MRLELYTFALFLVLTPLNACVTAELLPETVDASASQERGSEADAESQALESNDPDGGETSAVSTGPVPLEGGQNDSTPDAVDAAPDADSSGTDEPDVQESDPVVDHSDAASDSGDSEAAAPETLADASDAQDEEAATNCVPLPESGRILVGGQLQLTSEQWHRPNGYGCDLPTSIGSSFPYALHVFCNTAVEGEFAISAVGQAYGDWSALADPVLFVYAGGELPQDAMSCLDFDDDSYGGGGALVDNLTVGAGERITVVVTSFNEDDTGYYEVEVEQN